MYRVLITTGVSYGNIVINEYEAHQSTWVCITLVFLHAGSCFGGSPAAGLTVIKLCLTVRSHALTKRNDDLRYLAGYSAFHCMELLIDREALDWFQHQLIANLYF